MNKTVRLKLAQMLGQHFLRDAGKRTLQFERAQGRVRIKTKQDG
ncbi:hypothetical protein [Luteibacter sp. 22Crub2.1]|nr:hypothetical protein [Luteibacter sp. 22Crub2.1]